MKKHLLFIVVLYYCFGGNAQQEKFADKSFYLVDSLVLEELPVDYLALIDSCLTLYHKTDIDSLKLKYLNIIIDNVYIDLWYEYQKNATKIVDEKLNGPLSKKDREVYLIFKASSLNNEGYWFVGKNQIEKGVKLYEEAIQAYRQLKKYSDLATVQGNLGNCYYRLGKIEKAIEVYEESVLISKKTKDKNTSYIISNLAMIYHNLGRDDEALKLLKEAELYDVSEANSIQKAKIYTDFGIIYKQKFNDYDTAIYYYKMSLNIHKKLKNEYGISSQYHYLGEAYLGKGENRKALGYYKKSLEINLKLNDVESISTDYCDLSLGYYNLGKLDSCLFFGEKAYMFSVKSSSPRRIKEASEVLSKAYVEKEDYKNAFFFYKEFNKMQDSLNNNEITFTLAKTEAKLQYENEKELETIKHESELKIKEKEKEKQTLYKQGFIVGFLFLLLIVGLIIRQLYKSIKQKKVIEYTNTKLIEQHNEITSSITYAKRIQNAILPPLHTIEEVFNSSFVYYQPKDIVSGDFYWLEISQGKIHFAVADCTGHGVPGAMVSVVCNNGLNRSVREHQLNLPNEILDKTRDIVIQEFEKSGEDIKDGMDVSLVSIDLENNMLEFSGAHNSAWIIRKKDSEFDLIELKGEKQPIGVFEKATPFVSIKIELKKEDVIYLFTDGYVDQFGGERNKKIKSSNFKKLLFEIQDLEMKTQKHRLQEFFNTWKGKNDQVDDVCVVGIKI